MHFVKSYELDLLNFKKGGNLANIWDRCTIVLRAPAGNVLSTYFGPNGELMVNIEHNETYNYNITYTFIIVPNNEPLDLVHCRFINSAIEIKSRQDVKYLNNLFHVYLKDEVTFAR